MSRSNVLHILYSGLGGHSAVLFTLLEAGFLARSEHTVIFAGVECPPPDYLFRCEELNVKFHYVPKTAGFGNISFQRKLVRLILDNKPAVLFLHGLSALPALALLKFYPFFPRPFVIVRETQANQLKTRYDWTFLAMAYLIADRVVHLTDDAASGASKKLKWVAGRGKIVVVSNGLNTDFYAPRLQRPVGSKVINIGMQSRLQPNKDHKTLILAFAKLFHRRSLNIHLHIAGDGSTYTQVKSYISIHELDNVVTMHGFLTKSELRDFLNRLDIYVHCTHGETMSTAIMQAMSCGLPTIASKVFGVTNMLPRESGLLYEPGDPDDLSEKLENLIRDEEERLQLGARARQHAVNHFGARAMVNAYQALIPKS